MYVCWPRPPSHRWTLPCFFFLPNIFLKLSHWSNSILKITQKMMSFKTYAVLSTSRSCITSLWPKMTFSILELQMDMRMKRYICQQQYFSSKSGDTSQLDITGTNNVGCAKDFPFLKYLMDMSLPGRHYTTKDI